MPLSFSLSPQMASLTPDYEQEKANEFIVDWRRFYLVSPERSASPIAEAMAYTLYPNTPKGIVRNQIAGLTEQ
ncbi:MAG: hypothetical protein ACQKBT_02305 [Puniceicoccales bacterium]